VRRSPAISAVLFALAVAAVPRSAGADEPKPAPTDEAKEQARLHFTAGVNLLRDPDKARYEEAYAEFKRAYELIGSPNILGNIGLCAMKLERDAEAIDAYTRYLVEVPSLDADERAQTERDLVTLRAGLARISVETQPDGALIHDSRITVRGGTTILNVYGPLHGKTDLGLRRGHHVIKAKFPDGREVAWELDVNGGESHVFEEPALPPPDRTGPVEQTGRPIPPSVYIGALATGAFGIGTLVTGALALNTRSRFDAANDGTNESRATDLHGSAQTLNVTTDILLGLTVIGAAVTTYLYLSRPTVTTSVGAGQVGKNEGGKPAPRWLSPIQALRF
jgi:hypothetical protein